MAPLQMGVDTFTLAKLTDLPSSTFLNLKMERVWQKDYANHSEAINDVADYIVSFYNSERLHLTLGNLSPNVFERESAKQQSIDVSEKT